MERPVSLVLVVWLMIIHTAFSIFRDISEVFSLLKENVFSTDFLTDYAISLPLSFIAIIFCIAILKGKHWGRLGLTLLFIFSLALTIYSGIELIIAIEGFRLVLFLLILYQTEISHFFKIKQK